MSYEAMPHDFREGEDAIGIKETLKDIDAINLLLSIQESLICSICQDIMYCPCTTSCGHSFCYNCLYEWLKKGTQTKTCPTCREKIVTKPVLSHHLKDISDSLVGCISARDAQKKKYFDKQKEQAFAELLDDKKYQKEPFPLLFDEQGHNAPRSYIDTEDGVRRCPRCHWELEGTYCDNCDMVYDLGDDDAVGNRLDGEPGSENSLDEIDGNEPNEYEHDDFIDDRETDEILEGETSLYQDDWELGSELSGNDSLSGHYHSGEDQEEEDEEEEEEEEEEDSYDENAHRYAVRPPRIPYASSTTTTRTTSHHMTHVVEVSDSSDDEHQRVVGPSFSTSTRNAPVQVLDSDTSEEMEMDSEPEHRVIEKPDRRKRVIQEDSD